MVSLAKDEACPTCVLATFTLAATASFKPAEAVRLSSMTETRAASAARPVRRSPGPILLGQFVKRFNKQLHPLPAFSIQIVERNRHGVDLARDRLLNEFEGHIVRRHSGLHERRLKTGARLTDIGQCDRNISQRL